VENILFTILSFIVAIVILVGIHEFGHFWVARRLGVKVLRFSIGFGKPLWRWQGKHDQTEYVLAAIPMGGYVKMLDEREEEVAPEEAHRAFNRQSLKVRSAVVIAGPAFNFIFAAIAFCAVLMLGETGLRPYVGEVAANSIAQQAGLQAGDEITHVAGKPTPTWASVLQAIAEASVEGKDIALQVQTSQAIGNVYTLPYAQIGDIAEIKNLLEHLGMQPERPNIPPVFGEILPGEAAEQAGLKEGDRILSADGQAITDWAAWVNYVRERPQQTIRLDVERNSQSIELLLQPRAIEQNNKLIGRIGASNQPVEGLADRYYVLHQLPFIQAFIAGWQRTWDYSVLTLKVMWRIITGQASIQNLSGPFTIADAAGKTASYGLTSFLQFLAVISVSLGVLNLLPIPVLDGGHLLYFMFEAVRGSAIPESWAVQGQKIGLALLVALMGIAFYVDILRFWG
jgi:regulator of sigma E protease